MWDGGDSQDFSLLGWIPQEAGLNHWHIMALAHVLSARVPQANSSHVAGPTIDEGPLCQADGGSGGLKTMSVCSLSQTAWRGNTGVTSSAPLEATFPRRNVRLGGNAVFSVWIIHAELVFLTFLRCYGEAACEGS